MSLDDIIEESVAKPVGDVLRRARAPIPGERRSYKTRLAESCRSASETVEATSGLWLTSGATGSRAWLLGGDAPTFSDITMATAIAFSKFPVTILL